MFVGDDDSVQIVRLLDQTLNSIDGVAVHEATEALGRLSTELPHFPYRLLSIASGGENPSQRVAAATYLKNFTRRSTGTEGTILEVSKEFKDQLLQALLKAEPAVFHRLVDKMKSHMPSALSPLLGSFCRDMTRILESLSFEWSVTPSDGYLIRSKAGKRSLLLFGTLVKGGDLPDSSDSVDVYYDGKEFHELRSPRITTRNTHGTGCTLASCIAAELAKGSSMLSAVKVCLYTMLHGSL